ncbi:hypothetical protein [Bacillus sp. MRMR6]|uniref:hypothetical protein n=1 Tax=Bacillus sp. MRMR6 TaxID=1928617 RepID=UPI0009534611|nr:hypothetical protein [Bacillus sp. MRMR6]OLS34035.1 hypothetical protein BTR25_23055 [Bacillus sp. MRMR6]
MFVLILLVKERSIITASKVRIIGIIFLTLGTSYYLYFGNVLEEVVRLRYPEVFNVDIGEPVEWLPDVDDSYNPVFSDEDQEKIDKKAEVMNEETGKINALFFFLFASSFYFIFGREGISNFINETILKNKTRKENINHE